MIVDEAHTCVAPAGVGKSSQAHLRYALLRKLADEADTAFAAAHRDTRTAETTALGSR